MSMIRMGNGWHDGRMTDRFIAACDGACKGNPGPAAWAWVLLEGVDGGPGRWEAGPLGDATNNVAELTALERLLSAVDPAMRLEVRMDSQYAMNAVTTWLPGWRKRGWRTASGGPVANRDLIVRIDALLADRDVQFVYVPAHQVGGDPLNAFADQAASQAALSQQPGGGILPDKALVPAATATPPGERTAVDSGGVRRSPPTNTARTLAAKYPGTCRCGRPYEAGSQIAKNPQGWGHPECAASEVEQAAADFQRDHDSVIAGETNRSRKPSQWRRGSNPSAGRATRG
jgi:ribonuclease HI